MNLRIVITLILLIQNNGYVPLEIEKIPQSITIQLKVFYFLFRIFCYHLLLQNKGSYIVYTCNIICI